MSYAHPSEVSDLGPFFRIKDFKFYPSSNFLFDMYNLIKIHGGDRCLLQVFIVVFGIVNQQLAL